MVKIARQLKLHPSTLGSQIVTEWIEFYYYKIHRGDMTFSQPIMRKFFEMLDKDRLEAISEFASDYMIKEIRTQEGKVTYPVLVDHITKWNDGNHLVFNKVEQDGADVFISRHNLGKNWSEIECKTYAKAFKSIGQNVTSMEYDDEDTYSFEVIRRKPRTDN